MSVLLLIVLMLRRPVARQFGAGVVYLLWAIPVVTLLIWRLWPDRTQGLVLALGFALAMLLGLVPLLIVALYLPIFNLGASVG